MLSASRKGQGLVEYVLILVLAVVVVFLALSLVGQRTTTHIHNAANMVANAGT
ncbi:MAG: pilus assembly protein [Candidatus Brocadiae bacterium]|nr:pilus assembly protein [Candidatus Brocadiia bacterium]